MDGVTYRARPIATQRGNLLKVIGGLPRRVRGCFERRQPLSRRIVPESRGAHGPCKSGAEQSAPDVVMVLENCCYPLDSRVRNEAESLVEAGFVVEVLAPRQPDRPTREVVRGVRVTRLPLFDGQGELLGTALEYVSAGIVFSAVVLARLAHSRRAVLHVHNPPDFFFPLLLLARLRGWSTVFDHHDDAAGMLHARLNERRPSRAYSAGCATARRASAT